MSLKMAPLLHIGTWTLILSVALPLMSNAQPTNCDSTTIIHTVLIQIVPEQVESYDSPISIMVRSRDSAPRRSLAIPVKDQFMWQLTFPEADSLRLADIGLEPLREGYRPVTIQEARLLYWQGECVVESWFGFEEIQQFWQAEVTSTPTGIRIVYLDSSKIVDYSLFTPPLDWNVNLPMDIYYNSKNSYEFVLSANNLAKHADSTIKHDRKYIQSVVKKDTTKPRNMHFWGRSQALMEERQITIEEVRFKLRR